jgi:hypothetical protein
MIAAISIISSAFCNWRHADGDYAGRHSSGVYDLVWLNSPLLACGYEILDLQVVAASFLRPESGIRL